MLHLATIDPLVFTPPAIASDAAPAHRPVGLGDSLSTGVGRSDRGRCWRFRRHEGGRPEFLPREGLHPIAAGAELMAKPLADFITAALFGLPQRQAMPEPTP